MSSRLRYSPKAFIRAMQMSRSKLHVFVEGRDVDSFVYGRLCDAECGSVTYRLTRADELPQATTGGKDQLLKFFVTLRRRGALVESFQGQKHASIFFVDKDIDDVLGRRKRSPHVVYTKTYDVEGEVYRSGDLETSVAAICSLDPRHVAAENRKHGDWRLEALILWKEWAELCVAAKMAAAHGVVGYAAPSLVNPTPATAADPVAIKQHEALIINKCSRGAAVGRRQRARAKNIVDTRYKRAESYSVFKGKWFGHIVPALVERSFPKPARRVKAFADQLVGHMAHSLDVGEPWAQPYRNAIRSVLAMC